MLEKLPGAINEFVAWTGQAAPEAVEIDVVEEVESTIEADEDTEVLISADRAALTEQDWSQLRESLAKSRSELVALLAGLADDELESKREESERTVREEVEHIAFVELMYAMWTFRSAISGRARGVSELDTQGLGGANAATGRARCH